MKKALRWTVKILLVFLVVFAGFVAEESIRGRIALTLYKAELRAKGEKLTFRELAVTNYTSKRDETAVLILGASELETLRQTGPHGLSFVSKLWWDAPGRVLILHTQEMPRAGTMRLNASPERELSILPAMETKFRRATWKDVDKLLTAASGPLTKVKLSLGHCPDGVVPDSGRSSDTAPRGETALRNLPHWFGAEAIWQLHVGNREAAVDELGNLIALIEFSRNVWAPNVQHVRMDTADRALDVTWQLVATSLNDDELKRLQRLWDFGVVVPDMLKTMEVERARQLRDYDEVRADWRKWQRIWRPMVGVYEPNPPDEYDFAWFCRDVMQTARLVLWRLAWMDFDDAQYLKQAQWELDLARRAADAGSIGVFFESHDEFPDAKNGYDALRFVVCRGVAPDTGLILLAMYFETRREMTITAIALTRYHLRYGKFPAALRELQPEFLSAVPRDWVDGEPLRYRLKHDATYTLYSVGWNRRDDGGDASALDPPRLASIWDGRDAVWPQPVISR